MMVDGGAIRTLIQQGKIEVYRTEADDTQSRPCVYVLRIGPNSVDVTLGHKMLRPVTNSLVDPFDPSTIKFEDHEPIPVSGDKKAFMLWTGVTYLGFAAERFVIQPKCGHDGSNLVQMLDGRSTVGRLGITVHVTAGFGDIGFGGNFTLEIVNLNRAPILLYPGMRIGQIAFHEVRDSGMNTVYTGAYSSNHIGRPVPPILGIDRF